APRSAGAWPRRRRARPRWRGGRGPRARGTARIRARPGARPGRRAWTAGARSRPGPRRVPPRGRPPRARSAPELPRGPRGARGLQRGLQLLDAGAQRAALVVEPRPQLIGLGKLLGQAGRVLHLGARDLKLLSELRRAAVELAGGGLQIGDALLGRVGAGAQ